MLKYFLARRTQQIVGFLCSTTAQTSLFLSPTSLTLLDVTFVLITLFVKSISQRLGFSRSITKYVKEDGSINLPENLRLQMVLDLKTKDVNDYLGAIGRDKEEEDREISGPQMAMFLSAVTEPTMLLLLAHRKCPIQPIGAVNVRNTIRLLRPDIATLDNINKPGAVWVTDATLKKKATWVKRGAEFEFVVSLRRIMDGLVDEVFEQSFTMLQFMKHSRRVQDHGQAADAPDEEANKFSSSIPLEASSPSKWARSCKDYNPIHTSTILAKVFGFPGKIAHGNLVLARAMEAARRYHKDNIEVSLLDDGKRLEIDVDFKRPVVVPVTLDLEFNTNKMNSEVSITVSRKGKVCIQAICQAK